MTSNLSDLKIHKHLKENDRTNLIFSSLKNASFPSPDSSVGMSLIHSAEDIMQENIPALPITFYMEYLSNGNRTNYEKPYYQRRNCLKTFLFAECIEKKGRFINAIIDYTWAILDETTWILPAHNWTPPPQREKNLPDCFKSGPWFVDLFSAMTGSLLALVYYYLHEDFEKANASTVNERILYELNRRIITPILNTNDMNWMGFRGQALNNWTPWIISNVLCVIASIVPELSVSAAIVEKLCRSLDLFTSSYPSDGGCNEGADYWHSTGAAFFDCLEILSEISNIDDELFHNNRYLNIVEFIYKVHINKRYGVTFGDSHSEISFDGKLCRRIGRRFNSEIMLGFGQCVIDKYGDTDSQNFYYLSRYIRNLLDNEKSDIPYTPATFSALTDMQLCTMRETNNSEKGFYAWIKGGHNNESHNHNDLGSIGVYFDGEPLFIDIGIGEYTRATFSGERYTLFPIRSCDHNIPTINGHGQYAGSEYHTDYFNIDENKRTVSVGLKNAYENKDEIIEYTRTLSLQQCITIADRISLVNPGEAEFNFYTPYLPTISPDSSVIIRNDIVMRYSDVLTAQIEKIDLVDRNLKRDWKTDCLYRLYFSTKSKSALIDVKFEIHK